MKRETLINGEKIVISNIHRFYEIAQDSFEIMNSDMTKNIRPKPDGEEGNIMTYDPKHTGFKNAIVTVVFCGVYLESLLHLLIVDQKGIETYEKNDRKVYEEKLKLLGCEDPSILKLCLNFRATRKEIVHEKAYMDTGNFKTAQAEASQAMLLVNKVNEYFNVSMG